MRITNIMPVYDINKKEIEVRVSVVSDESNTSVNADLVLTTDEIDLSPIIELCKEKIRVSISDEEESNG